MALGAVGTVTGCGDGEAATTMCELNLTMTNAGVIRCPDLTAVRVGPDAAPVGGTVAVIATAAGVIDAGTTLFAWSAPSGSFGSPSSPVTTFMCTAPGTVTITIAATQEGCSEAMSTTVDCVAGDGG